MVEIRELLGPTSSNILKHNLLLKDKKTSFYIFSQDVYGWENWLNKNDIPFTDNAEELMVEAADKIGLSKEQYANYLEGSGSEYSIPCCVYKENKEGWNGNVVAWAHVLNIYPEHRDNCPSYIRDQVSDHTKEYQGNLKKDEKPLKQHKEEVDAKKRPARKYSGLKEKSELNSEDKILEKRLALLGRELVQKIGSKQGSWKRLSGKAKYRIDLNITNNTMRIYSKERGDIPLSTGQKLAE